MSSVQTRSFHREREITWLDQQECVVGYLDGMRLCIEKLPNRGRALTDDGTVVRFMPRQYRTTVDKIIANPKCPIRTDLSLAKDDAVAFALELPSRILAKRETRRAELLSKLSLPNDTAD
jgi:hypothetical protein